MTSLPCPVSISCLHHLVNVKLGSLTLKQFQKIGIKILISNHSLSQLIFFLKKTQQHHLGLPLPYTGPLYEWKTKKRNYPCLFDNFYLMRRVTLPFTAKQDKLWKNQFTHNFASLLDFAAKNRWTAVWLTAQSGNKPKAPPMIRLQIDRRWVGSGFKL